MSSDKKIPASSRFPVDKELFELMRDANYGELHFKHDPATGMCAIIAIHNTKLGPALGGCRFYHYNSMQEAVFDVMRLAEGMSYKAALAGLPLGGGKSVIIRPRHDINRDHYFECFGQFVEDLGGRYITAMDSGTHEEDMNIIARKTRHVASQSQPGGVSGDPCPFTAEGGFLGIKAAAKFALDKTNLENIHVVLQGVGGVGYRLAKQLHAEGAKLTVCDISEEHVKRCVNEFGAKVVSVDDCYKVECDIFSPNALGGTINEHTIPLLKTKVIAGCANNQLGKQEDGQTLKDKNILYTPDYVINAGGLVRAAALYFKNSEAETKEKIGQIYHRLIEIFTRAQKENKPTNQVADTMAQELIR